MWVEDVGAGMEGYASMEDYVVHEIDTALSSLAEWCSIAFEKIHAKGKDWYGSLVMEYDGEIELDLMKSESMEAVFSEGGVVGLRADKKQLLRKIKSEVFNGLLSLLEQVEIHLLHEGDHEERWNILQSCSRQIKSAMRRLVKCAAMIDASAGVESVVEDVPKGSPSRCKQKPADQGKLWEDVEILETVVEEEDSEL
ncbi:hypothetical protein HDU81_004786 [Chytriomyces hyalinus]|nr:hypothetical protein HDU81_004786 [Chytriomyces hyalinus]